jgi:hypothetical protein
MGFYTRSSITEAEAANITKWNGEPGHYEVYYIKFNHIESSTAYWIRYTLLAPLNGSAVAELWAIFFDSKEPSNNKAVKNTFPVSETEIKRGSFSFRIGDAVISQTGAHGGIRSREGAIRWDLRFEPVVQIFYHFPYKLMYSTPVPKTKAVSPNFNIKVYGKVEVNGETYECKGEPGQQTHLWGTKHAEKWTWANSSIFKEDHGAIFEGLSAQIKMGSRLSPGLTLFFIKCLGKDYRLNNIIQLFRNKSDSVFPVWRFTGTKGSMRFSGEIKAGLESFVGVEYTDPDGEKLWCYNSKVADMELAVYEEDKKIITLTSDKSCALEFVSRSKDPRIPIRI